MILVGDSFEMLAARLVKFRNQDLECFHLSGHFGRAIRGSGVTAPFGYAKGLARLFDFSQIDTGLSLFAFDSKKRKHRGQRGKSFFVSNLPHIKAPSLLCAGLAVIKSATKSFAQKIYRMRLNLLYANTLTVSRLGRVTHYAHRVCVSLYANSPVRINDSSQVCKINFIHKIYLPQGRANGI